MLRLDSEFEQIENIGCKALKDSCFIINCYNLIEQDPPKSVLMTKICSLNPKILIHSYIEYVLEFQKRTRVVNNDESIIIPIYLIVIEEIYDQLVDLLNLNDLYGLQSNQITLYIQFKVPSFHGNENKFIFKDEKLTTS